MSKDELDKRSMKALLASASAWYEQMKAGDWERFTTFNPDPKSLVWVTEGMTGEQLLALQKEANSEFYKQPKVFLRQILRIREIGFRNAILSMRALFGK